MGTTFAQLGIPFPLFEAPVERAPDYVGLKTCSLCHMEGRHCFQLNGSDDVAVWCSVCQTENGLSANDKEDGAACTKCGAVLDFPPNVKEGTQEEPMLTCYECLRAGCAAITKVTVLGMIRWEDAARGQTHGVPRLNRSDVELVTVEDDWTAARLAPDMMWELLRTPGYLTWQGEQWQFDEGKPMIYVGEWNRAAFNRYALNGNGKRFFYEIVPDTYDGQWDDLPNEHSSVYVFRSATREINAAHWDMD